MSRALRTAKQTGAHPAVAEIARWFEWAHLPPDLAALSSSVDELAAEMIDAGLYGPELTTGLRKLLEAKDCFVRAAIAAAPQPESDDS